MYVYFKRGRQVDEEGELHREYKRRFGRWPHERNALDFEWHPKLGLTIVPEVDPGWWENRLTARGWLGLERELWLRFFAWIQKPGSAARLRQLLTELETDA